MDQSERVFEGALAGYEGTEIFRKEVGTTPPLEYIHNQKGRWIKTLEWLERYLPSKGKILELGGEGFFSYLIRYVHPEIDLQSTGDMDLRGSFPFFNESFDMILNMEVLEHIKDLEGSEPIDLVNFSGMRHVLSECRRVLRVGGKMFLSTPNAASYMNLSLLLINKPPLVDFNHFKELTVSALRDMLETEEFQIDRLETVFVFYPAVVDHLKILISTIDHEKGGRGDDIFAMVSRTD